MQEFTTVSSSSYDPAALANKLNDKSAEGWTVVSIVSTGGDVTAFLSREAGAATTAADTGSANSATSATSDSQWGLGAAAGASALTLGNSQPEPEPTLAPVAEPAGWGIAPEQAATPAAAAATYTPAAAEPAPVAPAAAPTPSVPAGWYADPAGRFELRYWDGGTWTEHVSRAGQQYTDPPVA